jgi:16S rRNA (uracil1498-N3)-methyltransferase
VNILILEKDEIGRLIPRSDRRYEHVKKVLRKLPGDRMAAGIACDADGIAGDADSLAGGALGEAIVHALDDSGLVLDFEAFAGREGVPPPLAPLSLVLGFPRPIQAARILKDLTSLGLAEIHLTGTELGEKSYASSSIFKDKDFRRPLIEGAEQAGNPRLPAVFTHWSLRLCLEALAARDAASGLPVAGTRLFLHPYGDAERMGAAAGKPGSLAAPAILAVGSERGWTEGETAALGAAGFEARSLGGRILKTETAALAASVLALAGLGLL